jgi:hypothetical protein
VYPLLTTDSQTTRSSGWPTRGPHLGQRWRADPRVCSIDAVVQVIGPQLGTDRRCRSADTAVQGNPGRWCGVGDGPKGVGGPVTDAARYPWRHDHCAGLGDVGPVRTQAQALSTRAKGFGVMIGRGDLSGLMANGVTPQPDEPCRGRLPLLGQAHAGTRGQSDRPPPLSTPSPSFR